MSDDNSSSQLKLFHLDLSDELLDLKETILTIVSLKDYEKLEEVIDYDFLLSQFIVTAVEKGEEALDCFILDELYKLCFSKDDIYLINQLIDEVYKFIVKKKEEYIFLGGAEEIESIMCFLRLPSIVIGITYDFKHNST